MTSWNFGAAVNISRSNSGLTTAQVGEAKAILANLRATEEATRQNVTLEVRTALLNLRQQAESIVVADKGLQQARENLALAEGRYKTGVGNIIELTDAQVALVSAEASRVQALVGYRTALATLARAGASRARPSPPPPRSSPPPRRTTSSGRRAARRPPATSPPPSIAGRSSRRSMRPAP